MSYLSDHIIPGTSGKIFLVNASQHEYPIILRILGKIKGIGSIAFQDKVFPHEMTISSACPVSVKEIQERIRNVGFHAIPKSYLQL